MSLPIIIRGKDQSYSCRIPTSWNDVNIRQYFEILKWSLTDKDPVRLYSILTGIDYDIMFQCQEYAVSEVIDKHTEFIREDPNVHTKKPDFVDIRGKKIEVPKTLSVKPLGVILGLESEFSEINKIEDEYEKQIKSLCTSVAYVLCEAISGKAHDNEEADKLIPEIEQLPVTTVMPLALFFWRNIARSKSGGTIGLATKLKDWMKGRFRRRSNGRETSGSSTASQKET